MPSPLLNPAESIAIHSISSGFAQWLHEQRLCVAASTYQHDQLVFLSGSATDHVQVSSYAFDRPMGMIFTAAQFQLATRQHVWQFERTSGLAASQNQDPPTVYKLEQLVATGYLDAHDLVKSRTATSFLVDTHHSCIREIRPQSDPAPVWHPDFITRLAPEDRCHLNGVAEENGQLRYATLVAPSDEPEGWRHHRELGGLVIDIQTNEIVAQNLTMPHSPRIHRDRIWVLNAGTGEFGFVDPQGRGFNAIAFCPGFLRGLAFHNEFAVLGLSQARKNRKFSDLPLGQQLSSRGVDAICGLIVINIETQQIEGQLRFAEPLTELFDVQLAWGLGHPTLLEGRRSHSQADDTTSLNHIET